jgi:3-oxoacyl-[acyl-carrier protein] reductase
MLMSVIEEARSAAAYPELAGKRVLITGITSSCGVDVAQAFAEHRTKLILQFAEGGECVDAIAELAAPAALAIETFGPIGPSTDAAVQFARTGAKVFGGIDVLVNLVALAPPKLEAVTAVADIEAMVASRLLLPCVLANVVANRMALMFNEGVIINIASLANRSAGNQAFATMVKSAMTAMTRRQAEEWAARAIRFNAIAPQIATGWCEEILSGETDVAGLALYLASTRGKTLSGLIFEAEIGR